jgi:hypothetical protein
MKLSLEANPSSQYKKCPTCKSKYLSITDFILNDGSAYAVGYIECHRHNKVPELFFTTIFGTWDEDKNDDHITFSCRYGEIVKGGEFACTLLNVSDAYNKPIFGKRLTRDEATSHQKISEFWKVVDYLLEDDPLIHDYLNHPLKSRIRHLV